MRTLHHHTITRPPRSSTDVEPTGCNTDPTPSFSVDHAAQSCSRTETRSYTEAFNPDQLVPFIVDDTLTTVSLHDFDLHLYRIRLKGSNP
jgi:hypothetical protein